MGFAYMQYSKMDVRFLQDNGTDVTGFYNRTFESDIRRCNDKYRTLCVANELMRKRAIGSEKIAVAKELILSTLDDYKNHFCTPDVLRKQMTEACYIKGTDLFWIHGCIEAAQEFYNKQFK